MINRIGIFSINQLIRYGVVGLGINLLLYLAYLLISYFGLEPKKSMSLVYFVGVVIGFYGHRKWTFANKGFVGQPLLRFLFAHVIGYSINFFILSVFVDYYGYPNQLIQGMAIFVVAGILFVLFKYWVFSK